MTDLPKSFDPADIETKWYRHWEDSGCFAPTGSGEPYTILLPPPNVTGTLHMGHAFQHTLMDCLVRYHRMRGYDTLWQVGTDHAGIATEMVVSRNLALGGTGETRDSLGRDGFIEKVWAWKQESGDTIERQMRRIGASADWSRSVFTMDEMPSKAVVECFVRLFDEGLIYRGKKLVNWDPVLKTAISDLEVVSEEEDGRMWSIRYPLADGSSYEYVERDADGNEVLRETRDYLVVATTRPETMLGDTAVAVHPEDPRYAHLVGRSIRLPLTDREIPIIADTYVEKDFGTGCVKITPAHDFNDHAIGLRHALPLINLFNDDASLNENAPDAYRGMDRFVARKAVLADLESAGLLVEEKKHKLMVPRGDRTGQVIEPYLTDQWFVKMDELAARGLQLVESGAVRFVPDNWRSTYRHWLDNIQDWCISRQLWWGHRIPAWYDEAGNIIVARDEAEAQSKAGRGVALRRDSDVLETWFSSALWPFSTLGWPDTAAMQQRGFDRYLPSSVLVTGFDIIFFWVARMIMMTDRFTANVPFRDVYITGLVRDSHGQKMSKSKGNVLDPIDLIDGISADDLVAKRTAGLMKPQDAPKIEKATRKEFPEGIAAFGADALRFTFASLATHGRDIKFDLGRCEGYKAFCNKLWNAARFVLMNCPPDAPLAEAAGDSDAERWIRMRHDRTVRAVATHLADYRFDLAAQALYEFTWNELCDWFIELSKPALTGDDAAAAARVRRSLLEVLESTLRALHPLVPFVTEEIWQTVAKRLGIDGSSISRQPYPQAGDADAASLQAEADIEWLKRVVLEIRRIRSDMNLSPGRSIDLLLSGGNDSDRSRASRFDAQLRFLLRADSIDWLAAGGNAPAAAAAIVGELTLRVPLAGLVDVEAERSRVEREIKRIEAEIGKCNGKLGNATFVENAPAAVVEQERQRLADWTSQRDGLRAQFEALGQ